MPQNQLGHRNSLYEPVQGLQVTVPASQYGATSSQPTSPMTDFSGHTFPKALTPNSYQYGNHAVRGRPYAHSVDFAFPKRNVQPREHRTGTAMATGREVKI